MCGRAYETYTDEELYFRYLSKRPVIPLNLIPIYNLCPTMISPVLRQLGGERRIDKMHWQLVPDWEPTFKTKLSTINAKSETLFTSKLFRDLVIRQRCIVPVSGFFEWKQTGQPKRPFKIHLVDEPIMSMAGIWSIWRPGTLEERSCFSIVTTVANEFMSKIHARMPVILDRSGEDAWLDEEVHEQEELQKLFKSCPDSWLTAVEVSPLVNSAKNNSAEILEPAGAHHGRPALLFE